MYQAEKEVELAEARLIEARTFFENFREKTRSYNLSAEAISQIEIIASLEKERINLNSRIYSLSDLLDSDSPSVRILKNKSKALEAQIKAHKGGLNLNENDDNLVELFSIEEKAMAEKSFAEEAYYFAVKNLETARIEATRNQRYLAVFAKPMLPESAIYPKRLSYSIWLFISIFLVWGILRLFLQSLKDHLRSGWTD